MPANDPNKLWVALSEYGEGNIFHVYPKILTELLQQEDAARQEGDTSEVETMVLPSDKEWRLQQYFEMVAMQKDLEVSEMEMEDREHKVQESPEEPVEEWAPWNFVVPFKDSNAPPPVDVKATLGPAWDIVKVLKAAKLVRKPPSKVEFLDEQEMRFVYSLIYDVFRYKNILEQAIDAIDFFEIYPHFTNDRHAVWLFLMELARRRWIARPRAELERATQIMIEAGSPYREIEGAVWDQRVHFAAAIAKIRIKNKAFSLSDLLPPHLREERISACVNKETVTGWVNTFKTKKVASLVKQLHELGYSYSNSKQLCAGEYRFDRVCPRFITIRPPADASIGQLDLVKDGIIVLQEREFCEGASILCRALQANLLQGVVAQTHASSPRCSAYLAAQLNELAAILKAKMPSAPATPELGKLVVFGAGDRVGSYVGALRDMGIDASEAPQFSAPVCVLSEPVHQDTPMVATALEKVVAVLATPPNSYSSVTDPIDLVCGRGGDLAMLEILTETEIDSNGRARAQSILEEQKKTLKTLLSKPQIQLVLYETHSALEAENQAQVTRAVEEANRLAKERHVWLKKKPRDHHHHSAKLKQSTDNLTTESVYSLEKNDLESDKDDSISNSTIEYSQRALTSRPASEKSKLSSRPVSDDTVLKKYVNRTDMEAKYTRKAKPIPEIPEEEEEETIQPSNKDRHEIYVPNCDLFELTTLPNLGNGLDINYILDRDGCYLGLIQRKEITRLDAKYMIRVAEERGLFGSGQSAAPQPRRKRDQPTAAVTPSRRRKKNTFEVERVSAPTYASLSRSSRRGSAPAATNMTFEDMDGMDLRICARHAKRLAAAGAAVSAACTCDAKHRLQRRFNVRQTSDDCDITKSANPSPRCCRQPFPVVVHDLRLKTVTHKSVI